MFKSTRVAAWLLVVVLLPAGDLWAATVRFNLVPASNRNARTRTILTGSRIKYFLTVEVISDTAETDNSGLGLFNVDIDTDLTVEQPPATAFVPVIRDNFQLFPSLGTPAGADDLTAIGASQSTFTSTSAQTGFGQRGAQDLVEGFFQAPSVEGTFEVIVDATTSSANVLAADFETNGGSISAREIVAGPGFTIITSNDAPEDPGDEIDPFAGIPNSLRFGLAGSAVGVAGLIVLAGLFVAGPWGAALGLFIGALMGLISLFFGGTMTAVGG